MALSSFEPAAPRFDVMWPLSRKAVTPVSSAPRFADLNGKTVAQLWDVLFRGEIIYPQVRDYIKARFPRVNFVGHENFGNFHSPREREVHSALPRKLRELGVDAAIVGIGA
jgi:hypothetical protein